MSSEGRTDQAICADMLSGAVDPLVVASRRSAQGLLSEVGVIQLDSSIRAFLKTGVFLSPQFSPVVLFSDGGNMSAIAERLCRYNYRAASLVGVDSAVLVSCVSLLFDVLGSSPREQRDKLRVLDECLSDSFPDRLSRFDRFQFNSLAVDLSFRLTAEDCRCFQDVLRYGLEAVELAKSLPQSLTGEALCRVHYWLGISLNETSPGNDERLKESVHYLTLCINDKLNCKGKLLGSALNSLGYSLRLLGQVTGQIEHFHVARSVLREALQYRVEDSERRITNANLRDVDECLLGQAGLREVPSVDAVLAE